MYQTLETLLFQETLNNKLMCPAE